MTLSIALTLMSLRLANNVRTTTAEMTMALPQCTVEKDGVYHGVLVNCQHQGISSLPIPDYWTPPNTTSLILAFNNITHLENSSFNFLKERNNLRLLDLSHNKISSLEPSTFSGFRTLQHLNLDSNQIILDKKCLNSQVFQGLGNLLVLYLRDNGNNEQEGIYPDSLFHALHELDTLALETFLGDLDFASLFLNTRRLSTLILTGGLNTITNNTFRTFESIKLKKLILPYRTYLHYTEVEAFHNLKYLNWLELRHINQGLDDTLESLGPFAKTNMTGLIFEGKRSADLTVERFNKNGILTRHRVRYVSSICVKQFAIINYGVILIESGVFENGVWTSCLESVDLSKNPLMGEKNAIVQVIALPKLKCMTCAGSRYFMFRNDHGRIKTWQPPVCSSEIQKPHRIGQTKLVFDLTVENNITHRQFISTVKFGNSRNSTLYKVINQNHKNFTGYQKVQQIKSKPGKTTTIYFSKQLRIVILNRMDHNLFYMDQNYEIDGGGRVLEFHLADNGIKQFTGYLSGLPSLKLFDISQNNGSIMSPSFFDSLPSIVHLNMADMNLDTEFMAIYSNRLFRNMRKLATLDLSKNHLDFLAAETFEVNVELSVLVLAENRFQSIPFALRHLRELCFLDMSKNIISTLSDKDIVSLEDHFKAVNGSFSLSLNGNEISCGCDNIRFLSWLRRTRINLDNKGNYSCQLDSSITTYTSNIKDLEDLWRTCHGQVAFWISLVLMCITASSFLIVILVSKFKFLIKVYLIRTFWSPFIMKSPKDYAIGVYIGYADREISLACMKLRPFIEHELHLSTYVRDLNQLPGTLIAESITEAVHLSWRVLLVVSRDFLEDPWSYFLLMASTYAVQTENPGRIVLILMDEAGSESLMSKMPDCVLRAVREESIIFMTPSGNISYEDKEALKTALSY